MPVTQPGMVSQLLGLLPKRLLALLDAWSYRVARDRAEKRRRRDGATAPRQ